MPENQQMQTDSEIDNLFNLARDTLKQISKSKLLPEEWLDMSIENRLFTYAYYKQSTHGKCEKEQPEWWNSAGRYKWSTWKKLDEMSSRDAKIGYLTTTLQILDPLAKLSAEQLRAGYNLYSDEEQKVELQTLVEKLNDAHQKLYSKLKRSIIRGPVADKTIDNLESLPKNKKTAASLIASKLTQQVSKRKVQHVTSNKVLVKPIRKRHWVPLIVLFLIFKRNWLYNFIKMWKTSV